MEIIAEIIACRFCGAEVELVDTDEIEASACDGCRTAATRGNLDRL